MNPTQLASSLSCGGGERLAERNASRSRRRDSGRGCDLLDVMMPRSGIQGGGHDTAVHVKMGCFDEQRSQYTSFKGTDSSAG